MVRPFSSSLEGPAAGRADDLLAYGRKRSFLRDRSGNCPFCMNSTGHRLFS